MSGTLLKVILTAMFLLCGTAYLLEAADSPKRIKKDLKRMRHNMADFLATLKSHKLTSSSVASFIDWYLFNYNRNSAVDSMDVDVVTREWYFTEHHATLWMPFLQWLEVFPKKETPNSKAEAIITLPVQLQDTIEATLKHPGSSPEREAYLVLDNFNREYREKVALPGRIPKNDVRFKIARMSEYMLIGEWLLEEWKKQGGTLKKLEKLDKEIATVQGQIERIHERRERLTLSTTTFVDFLTEYVESRIANESSVSLCGPPKAGMKVGELHNCYWANFLHEIGAVPHNVEIDCTAKSLIQVSEEQLEERVKSPVLANIRRQKKGASFQVKQLLESFYRGYRQLLVLTCWDGKFPENNDKTFWLERMAEFSALANWRLRNLGDETPEETAPEKIETCSKKQKCIIKGVGAIIGAGIAVKYGLPPLWNAIFGKANETEETTPGQEEKEKFKKVEVPNVEKEAEKPQVTGKYKEAITKDKPRSKTWIYILLVGLLLLAFTIGVVVTGRWLSGFFQVRDPSDTAGLSQTLQHLNDSRSSVSASTIDERSSSQVNPSTDPGSGKYYSWDSTGPSDGRIHSQPNLFTGLDPSASLSQQARRHTS